jgi:hypothetical protein
MFAPYCIIVLGNNASEADKHVEKFSEIKLGHLLSQNVYISTFVSMVDIAEMTDWFRSRGMNFFIFKVDPEVSGFGLTKKEMENGLFGLIDFINTTEMTDQFLKSQFNNQASDVEIVDKVSDYLNLDNVEHMSPFEKEMLINKILDKGVENMSEEDKKILSILTK